MIGKIGRNNKYFIRNALTGFPPHFAYHHSCMVFYPLVTMNQKTKPVLLPLFCVVFGYHGICLLFK